MIESGEDANIGAMTTQRTRRHLPGWSVLAPLAAAKAANPVTPPRASRNQVRVPTDPEKILKILVDAGYTGWLALEYSDDPEPPEVVPGQVKMLKPLFEGSRNPA